MKSKKSQPLPEPLAPYDENVPSVKPIGPPPPMPPPPMVEETYMTIAQTVNGFVVTTPHLYGKRTSMVFEQREGDDCMVTALIRALHSVIEGLGSQGTKHDTCRIKVSCQNEENENA